MADYLLTHTRRLQVTTTACWKLKNTAHLAGFADVDLLADSDLNVV
jgi:hypothetical protein